MLVALKKMIGSVGLFFDKKGGTKEVAQWLRRLFKEGLKKRKVSGPIYTGKEDERDYSHHR